MSAPKPGENVRVALRNGEPLEGIVEWVDGNGAWIKNQEKSRWVPIELFLNPTTPSEAKKDSGAEE